jgi:hypothetical protein
MNVHRGVKLGDPNAPRFQKVLIYGILPVLCAVVALLGLWDGAAVIVSAERVRTRHVQEVLETRGIVTVPVERVIDPGRIDVVVQRRILGLIPISNESLADVTEISLSSGSNSVRRRPGGPVSSSYATEELILKQRDGREWRSPNASYFFGTAPSEIRDGLEQLLDGSGSRALRLWWVTWFSNLIGIPFALVSLLLILSGLRMWVRSLRGRAG